MRRLASFLIICAFAISHAYSQPSSLKGTITDTIERKNLSNSVVVLLRKNDSTLFRFTRTDAAGNFSLPRVPEGNYILMITHPFLGDYFDTVAISPNSNVDLGKVFMIPKSKLLAEVILKSGAPIRIKGDTTVYTADSFKVRAGANVEELLRRLPGIQVDKNGQITAMGEKVKKVLVDGEEFFGSDPGIATKNLRADIVNEVEVFDKKSDQAEFTGIDDGVKDKTINLKLKDDKKKGYFGKIEAAGGLKDKYNNDIMMNAFKGKRKIAAYGIMSNTGQTNLDWVDAQNYGGGGGMESGVSDDGGIYINWNGDDDEDFRSGRSGIPKNWNAGLHYNNKFNNNKLTLNSGYKFSKVDLPAVSSTFAKIFLPDSSWNTTTRDDNFSSTSKHAFNLTVESTLDSMNSVKWTTKANNRNGNTRNIYLSESLTESGDTINTSNRNSRGHTDNNNITSTLLWRHKFRKLSRTLSVNADFNWNLTTSNSLLFSGNDFYLGGVRDHSDTTDQQNISNNKGKGASVRIAYTEPLRKDFYMELSYATAYNTNSNERITTIKDFNGKYSEVVDSLSNSFQFNRLTSTPGISFRINKKKYSFSFGSSVGLNRFVQKNITNNESFNYTFNNFYPKASVSYKFKPNSQMRFNYNGTTSAPSLEQLQPTRINTDPLNIFVGNQDLNQSFRHSFNLNYGSYNVLKNERNIWTNLRFDLTQNAFVQSSEIDDLGRRVYRTVNADGIYSLNFNGDYGFKIKDTKWRLGFGPDIGINRYIDYVNGVRNNTHTNRYGFRVYASQYVNDKYNFNFGPVFSLNHAHASLNPEADADYWQLEGWASANIHLPHQFDLNSEANLQLRQKDPRFTNDNNYTNWNASVTKRFAKDVFEIKFGVYDLLNQNKGYERNFNSYSFTESYFTTLKRFWLLTFTWNIAKNGKPAGFGF